MRLYEFEAKNILTAHGIPIRQGTVVNTPKAAGEAVKGISKPIALKAQVLATGRSKVGGVKFVSSPVQAELT